MFKDLAWDADKIERIVTRLEPRYAQHSIFHLRDMGDLEHQLLRIPSGTHDDLVDCEQGLIQLLQYPKKKGKDPIKDDAFNWFRQLAIEARNPQRNDFVFGRRGIDRGIPAKKSWW